MARRPNILRRVVKPPPRSSSVGRPVNRHPPHLPRLPRIERRLLIRRPLPGILRPHRLPEAKTPKRSDYVARWDSIAPPPPTPLKKAFTKATAVSASGKGGRRAPSAKRLEKIPEPAWSHPWDDLIKSVDCAIAAVTRSVLFPADWL